MQKSLTWIDLENRKELHELHNNYPSASYQLKTADFTIFLLVLLKDWWPTLFKVMIEAKKFHPVLEFNQS